MARFCDIILVIHFKESGHEENHHASGHDDFYRHLSGRKLCLRTGNLPVFGVFGGYGIAGMAVAVFVFFLFGCMIMRISHRTGIRDFEKLVVRGYHPILRLIFGGFTLLFMFTVVMVVVAGAGALLEQLCGFPAFVGSIFMGLLLAVAGTTGARGMVSAFGFVVPFMVAVGLMVGLMSFFNLDLSPLATSPVSGSNPLVGNWLIAALTFVSYNLLVAISVLTPIAPSVESAR